MSKIIREGFDLNDILEHIKGGGNNFFLNQDIISIVASCIELSPQISPGTKRQIVGTAIRAIKHNKSISTKLLESTLRAEQTKFLKAPLKRYTLATTISISKNSAFLPIRRSVDGCLLFIGFGYPKKIKRSDIRIPEFHRRLESKVIGYAKICASANARSNSEAIKKIIDNIDFLRGLWNLSINLSTITRFSDNPKPVNNIMLGPIHTLHDSRGNPVVKSYWYEPLFYESTRTYNDARKMIKARKDEKKLLFKISGSKYEGLLKDAVIRYCRALDIYGYEAAFLKLWGILELLTDTVGQSYDITIKRTSFLFTDRDFHKLVLQHLRFQRNLYVHHGMESGNEEVVLYQLKRYVERVLLFHIFTKYKFKSIDEVGSFLSLPSEKAALKNRKKKIDYALKFFNINN